MARGAGGGLAEAAEEAAGVAEGLQRQVPDVMPVQEDAALAGVIKAQEELRHGRFSRTARPGDRQQLARLRREGFATLGISSRNQLAAAQPAQRD
jgi:hypothetical protein